MSDREILKIAMFERRLIITKDYSSEIVNKFSVFKKNKLRIRK